MFSSRPSPVLLTSLPLWKISTRRGPTSFVRSKSKRSNISTILYSERFVSRCFEFACEANFRKATIPEYKREYEEIEIRWVEWKAITISLVSWIKEDQRESVCFPNGPSCLLSTILARAIIQTTLYCLLLFLGPSKRSMGFNFTYNCRIPPIYVV